VCIVRLRCYIFGMLKRHKLSSRSFTFFHGLGKNAKRERRKTLWDLLKEVDHLFRQCVDSSHWWNLHIFLIEGFTSCDTAIVYPWMESSWKSVQSNKDKTCQEQFSDWVSFDNFRNFVDLVLKTLAETDETTLASLFWG